MKGTLPSQERDASAMSEPPEEFCTIRQRWALWIVYGQMVSLYLFGGAIILLHGVVAVGVLLGQIGVRSVFPPSAGWARALLLLLSAIGMLVGARYVQKRIRALKGVSLKVDASTIYVTDVRSDRYTVDLSEVRELRVRRSWWLGNHFCVALASGRQCRLPQGVKSVDALVEKIRTNAGLDEHCQEGRWDVYSRSDAGA
jgi:hypothetical protein